MANGKADAALISMEIPAGFLAKQSTMTFQVTPIARDAVVPVVSQMIYLSGVKDISLRDLKEIYSGKIKNWKELKGPNGNIITAMQKSSSGTQQVFMKAVFGNSAPNFSEKIKLFETAKEVQYFVAHSTSAIAVLPMTWTLPEARGLGIKTKRGILYPWSTDPPSS